MLRVVVHDGDRILRVWAFHAIQRIVFIVIVQLGVTVDFHFFCFFIVSNQSNFDHESYFNVSSRLSLQLGTLILVMPHLATVEALDVAEVFLLTLARFVARCAVASFWRSTSTSSSFLNLWLAGQSFRAELRFVSFLTTPVAVVRKEWASRCRHV